MGTDKERDVAMVRIVRHRISDATLLRDAVRPVVFVDGRRAAGVMEQMDGAPGPGECLGGFDSVDDDQRGSVLTRLCRWMEAKMKLGDLVKLLRDL